VPRLRVAALTAAVVARDAAPRSLDQGLGSLQRPRAAAAAAVATCTLAELLRERDGAG